MSAPLPNLDYASPSEPFGHLRRAAIFRRIALACALFPMATGLAIVLFYWLFDWDWLIAAGFVMLPVGGLAVLTGIIFAILWAVQRRAFARKTATPLPPFRVFGMFVLLLANFAVAFACIWIGATLALQPSILVTITNDSGIPLDRCTLRSSWSSRPHATLAPGDSLTEIFKQRRASNLRLHLEQGGTTKDTPLPLPTSSAGLFDPPATVTIHVRPNLDLDIQSSPAL